MPRPPDKINGGVEGFARFQCHYRIGNLVKIELYGWGTGPGPGGMKESGVVFNVLIVQGESGLVILLCQAISEPYMDVFQKSF